MAKPKSTKPGRPKTPIAASRKDIKDFFNGCDDLGLSLGEVQRFLNSHVLQAPSYRTLQEWRRGTHTPKFAPFPDWLELLRREQAAKKSS
jgi:hypothetical protein